MTTVKLSKNFRIQEEFIQFKTTPFHEDGKLDLDSLRKCEFCLEKVTHGIVMPVNASEVSTLTDEERTQVIKEEVKSVNGSVHFVAGVTGNSVEQVQESVKIVEDLGVDSIITMPSTKIASAQYVYDYFGQMSKSNKIANLDTRTTICKAN